MGRNKGTCTLCGKGGRLSFEHVPPEGGLNLRGVVMHTFDDWMQRETLDGPLPNGVPQPEGTGLLALCEPCNHFLGREYVPAHIRLVKAGQDVLTELTPRLEELDARLVTTVASLRLSEIDRLACATVRFDVEKRSAGSRSKLIFERLQELDEMFACQRTPKPDLDFWL